MVFFWLLLQFKNYNFDLTYNEDDVRSLTKL